MGKLKEEEPEYFSQPEEGEPEYSPQFDKDMYDETNDDIYGDNFVVNCGIVSVLSAEYDMVSKVSKMEDDFMPDETVGGKPLCYYVMNIGVVEKQKATFERPIPWMMDHLKPLFRRVKVYGVAVNKVFIDEGETVNLMPYNLFKKMGKCNDDLRQHNMVLSNYEGKISNITGVVQVDLYVDTTTHSKLFMVIDSKANFNLLLGREWIHGIGAVPSTVHQRLIIWCKTTSWKKLRATKVITESMMLGARRDLSTNIWRTSLHVMTNQVPILQSTPVAC